MLFVGINPSLRSEAVGHHFASPGNPFWRLLYAARLIPVALTHAEDGRLAEFGFALTNLCPRATRAAAELSREEIEHGKRRLERKIRRLRPAVVAFVGITIYRDFFGRSGAGNSGKISGKVSRKIPGKISGKVPDKISGAPSGEAASAGAGAKPELICDARVFVLPNPSGLNASFPGFKHKLVWFERMREFIDSPSRAPR